MTNEEIVKNAAEKSDNAIYIIGRSSGEDRENALEKGSFYLTDNEKIGEYTIVEINVFKANDLPKTNNPTINKPHVTTNTYISYDFKPNISNSGIKLFNVIEIPAIPPVIILYGNKNTPVPKANITVPITTNNIFFIVNKISFFV